MASMADAPPLPDTRADVEAMKDLLAWMREQGYWSETVTVGSVQLVGARDYLPSVKAQERAAAHADQASRGDAERAGDTLYDQVGRDLPGYERARGQLPGG